MATMHTHPQFGAVTDLASRREGSSAQKDAKKAETSEPPEPPTHGRTFVERFAERFGRPKLKLLGKQRRAVTAELRRIPERMQKVTNQARLVLELSDDFRSGTYRSISWVSIAIAAACLVYAVSPSDIVPDAIPALGAIDDMVVLTLAMRFLERDLRAYCRFKGYAEHDYF
jgi:uncharacterized membrane protein YkvA (DUF1232 family)